MHESMVRCLAALRKDLETFDTKSQIMEVIPVAGSDSIPIDEYDLQMLHWFAASNPIYHRSTEKTIAGTACIVYEGDINRYWLSSIRHGSKSRAPFSPTWMLSAYVCASLAKTHGFEQMIDIGSGDGRIAFCASMLGIESHSIEIDVALSDLQTRLLSSLSTSKLKSQQANAIKTNLTPHCADAATFKYGQLGLNKPIFCIGGLAQMGGTALATDILKKMYITPSEFEDKEVGWVFAGTDSPKYSPDPKGMSGWGTLVEENGLTYHQTMALPTYWTFGGQGSEDLTPYVFCTKRTLGTDNSNPN